jgi:CDP-diacylglycerol pyrophosphatase
LEELSSQCLQFHLVLHCLKAEVKEALGRKSAV